MRIRVRIGTADDPEGALLKLAGVSVVAHLVALIVFSVLPRLSRPVHAPRVTIAQIVSASSLQPARAPSRPPEGPTPSQRAEAARQALRPKPRALRQTRPRPNNEPDRPPLESRPVKNIEKPKPSAAPVPEAAPAAAPDGGISFSGTSDDLEVGVAPSIGSSAFPYDYYRASLMTILQSNWRRPVAPEGLQQPLRCRITFTIMKSGIVQNASIIERSGNSALDQSALRAVFDSNPLPPLPFQYAKNSVRAEVVFELTSD
ncbi:MAG: energy transducer TonB [Acidobacteriota bacterium]